MASKKDVVLFAKFDLNYADHPKIVRLSDAAFRAHVELILYARKYETDGLIPNRVANRVGSESLTELLSNDPDAPSLIDNGDGNYLLHGYSDANETRAEIEERKRRNSANGKRGGRPKKTHSVSDSDTRSQTDSGTQKKAETETETETETVRTVSKETVTRPARGSRLDPDWMPAPDLIQQMQAECPGADLESEHRKFIDYWIAQPGQKGVKTDWAATWRNWIRRSSGASSPRQVQGKPTAGDRARSIADEFRREGL